MKTGADEKNHMQVWGSFSGWMRKHRPIGCHEVLARWALLW